MLVCKKRSAAVGHALKLRLHGLPHLWLIVDGDKSGAVGIGAVGVVIDANIVASDVTHRDKRR